MMEPAKRPRVSKNLYEKVEENVHPLENHQLERNCSIQKTRSLSRSRGLVILQLAQPVSARSADEEESREERTARAPP